jgi:hypothetical protein
MTSDLRDNGTDGLNRRPNQAFASHAPLFLPGTGDRWSDPQMKSGSQKTFAVRPAPG